MRFNIIDDIPVTCYHHLNDRSRTTIQNSRWQNLGTDLRRCVRPVDSTLSNVIVDRADCFEAGQRNGDLVLMIAEGDSADSVAARVQQKRLGDHAVSAANGQFHADGTHAHITRRSVYTQVAATAVCLAATVFT